MRKKLSRGVCAGSAAAVLLLTAGCGSDGADSGDPKANQNPFPAGRDLLGGSGGLAGENSPAGAVGGAAVSGPAGAGTAPGASAGAGAGGALAVQQVPNLGTVVIDGQGFTLYRFDKDTANPPKSNCDGDCAAAWPPVASKGVGAATGITGQLGEVVRSDGTRQLTLAGWPLYRYAKDTAPGETKGDGVGGTWHAVAPDGKKANMQGMQGMQGMPGMPGMPGMGTGGQYGAGTGGQYGAGTGGQQGSGTAGAGGYGTAGGGSYGY